ncbi:MAG: oxidoreductase [Bacteroidales bacterium]|nr:oxidoreductase [Bacteroidales bacterium]
MKTAIISGATGLVGKQLLQQLLAHPTYEKVIAVVRRPVEIRHEKLIQRVIDFEQLPSVLEGVNADDGYCCLGTTIKTAGSKKRQYRIDHDYVVQFAEASHRSGVSRFAVVSSIGANVFSTNFYLRTKGEMEQDLKKIPFSSLVIMQPSFLMGERNESRAGEKIALGIMEVVSPLMIGGLKKYRGVSDTSVAASMIREIQKGQTGIQIIRSDQI